MLFEVLGVVTCIIIGVVTFIMWKHTYWQRRGIPTLKKTFLLGSFSQAFLKKKSIVTVFRDLYDETIEKGMKFGGIYTSTTPSILISDLDLIRLVTVKHFDHFTDRESIIDNSVDELFGKSLLSLRGNEWRSMRHNLSPAFTGSKLRSMMVLMSHIAHQYAHFLNNRTDPKQSLDMRQIFRRFAADIIATTAYGTASDSINNSKSEFYNNGIKLLGENSNRSLVFIGYLFIPKIMHKLKIKLVPDALSNFFENIITKNIQFRENENVSRPDMIQLLIEERKNNSKQNEKSMTKSNGKKSNITDMDIVSQAFTFFLGGFDTITTAMCFTTQALAAHPDVQERLRDEVDAAFKLGGGELGFEAVNEMKYMDMVVSEVLRMYPVVPFTNRICTIPLNLPEYGLNLVEGDSITIPYFAQHYNPDYFCDPERFDPERFNDDNKTNIKPYTYLPFGAGPRNCIGMRFALLELKLAIAYTLACSELQPSAKTVLPIKLAPGLVESVPVGGFILNVIPRSNPTVNFNKE